MKQARIFSNEIINGIGESSRENLTGDPHISHFDIEVFSPRNSGSVRISELNDKNSERFPSARD